jgi:hypothetical protein
MSASTALRARPIAALNQQQQQRFGDVDDRWTDIEIAKRCSDIKLHDIDDARAYLRQQAVIKALSSGNGLDEPPDPPAAD